jgi:exonuclease SbcC
MINKIHIKNIQSHEDSRLEFSKGLNVIVGESDAGKSAIIRALRWIIENRPMGDSIRSSWGGESKAVIQLTEGNEVGRVKSKKKNEYYLNNQIFKAIKSDVPPEIADALRLNYTNIKYQIDPHFLISKTPGEVAKHFNRVAQLNQIDLGYKNIDGWISGHKQDLSKIEKDIEEINQDLIQYKDLDKIETQVEVLEEIEKSKKNDKESKKQLRELKSQIEETDGKINAFDELLDFEKRIDPILNLYDKRKEVLTKASELQELTTEISKVQLDIDYEQSLLSHEEQIDSLISIIGKRDEKNEELEELSEIMENLNKTILRLERKENKLIDLEEEFHENMKGKCPLCGSKID